MEQEIKIKVDLEDKRQSLYDFISTWMINERYTFIYHYDYKWFSHCVVKKGPHILLDYDYMIKDDEHNSIIYIYYTYLDEADDRLHTGSVKLISQNRAYTVPDYQRGK